MPAHGPAPPVRAPGRVLVVLDGLGDRPHPDTGGRSPIDAAQTPHLDALAAAGQIGEVEVVGPTVAPESDAGVLSLFGYDPVHDSPGRGVLEALGAEVALAPGDVALRLNFATTDGAGTVLDARVGRSLGTSESRELARALTDGQLLAPLGIRAEVHATVGHRGVLTLHPERDGPLSPDVSNADPFYERIGGLGAAVRPTTPTVRLVTPLVEAPSAVRTADAINAFLAAAGPLLAGHTVNARRAMGGKKVANAILVRNAGALPAEPLPTFPSRYGFAGGAVTEMPVERGIARMLGLEDRFVGPMGPDRDAGYRDRASAVVELAARLPFVYVHLKGPDEPGHDGDARRKQEVVEAIDRSFFGPFLERFDLGASRLAVTADHATPCIVGGHSADPVPLVVAGAGVPAGGGPVKFGESAAARGALGRRPGRSVLPLLFSEPFSPAGR